MAEQVLTNTWAEVDEVTTKGKSKPFFDAYQAAPAPLAITAGIPQSPTNSVISTDQNSDLLINQFAPSGGSLQYTGTTPRRFILSFSGSITSGTNNVTTTIYGGINGSILPRSGIDRKIGTGADVGAVAGMFILTLNPNDTVDVFIDCDTNATITVEKGLYQCIAID